MEHAERQSSPTLTALVARGHRGEFEMHVRAAPRNGLTAEDTKEALVQTAISCGVPAANHAFAVAPGVLAAGGEGEEGA